MDSAEADRVFMDIKNKIEYKRNSLFDKYKYIKEASSENDLLKGVLNEYVEYYKQLIDEKKRKEQALVKLRDYLDNIDMALIKSDEQMDHLRSEKQHTIEKLEVVRQEMNKLLDKTKQ